MQLRLLHEWVVWPQEQLLRERAEDKQSIAALTHQLDSLREVTLPYSPLPQAPLVTDL